MVTLFRDGDQTSVDTILFDTAENSFNSGQTGRILRLNNVNSAVVEFRNTQGVSSAFVSKIVVEYQWRNDELISLNDRLQYVDDDAVPGGRRPVMGYTLLTRVAGDTSQLAIFTYEMEPLSAPTVDIVTKPILVPPETEALYNADNGLLRKAKLELGFESSTGKFYVVPVDPDMDDWAVERGQLLLVEKLLTPLGGSKGSTAGSDMPVRIVGQRRVRVGKNIEVRGVLDQSPRILGRSPLRNLNSRVTLTVWAFPATMTSLSDGTVWAIKPIEARIAQAVAPQ